MPNDNDVERWQRPILPTGGPSRIEILGQRHAIRRAVQNYLDAKGYIEIEPPLLVHGASPDICIDSFKVGDRYLVSSTEYQLKRMALGGFSRIYSLTKNFRDGDISPVRNPEFSMLEWGRIGGTMNEIENDAESMVAASLDALKLPSVISYQGKEINLRAPWEKMPVMDAVEYATGVAMKNFDAASCCRAAKAVGLEIRPDWEDDRDFLFSLLMDYIQPQLGVSRPVFLTEWPFFQTTSAGADADNPTIACRSELFIGGLEIADGFAGLADPVIQEKLFEDALALREQEGKEAVELDHRYLAAMRHGAPRGAGMAMGFDRLVMLLTDQSEIKNVLAFGWDEV
ncbi:MAG: amino acid--tRNA ligase-related protein [Bdellovibrionales bacterium]